MLQVSLGRHPLVEDSRGGGQTIDASVLLQREQISLIAPELQAALARMADVALREIPHPAFSRASDAAEHDEILYPYVWYFHGRLEIQEEIDQLPEESWLYVDRFRKYIEARMMDEWSNLEKLLEVGKISAKYMEYLFVSKPRHL